EDQAVLRHGDNGVIVNKDGVAVAGELTADNGLKAGLVGYDEEGNAIYGAQIGQDGSLSADNGQFVAKNGMVNFGNVADGTGVLVNSTTGSITATGSIAANQVIGKELGGGNGAFKVDANGKMTTTGEVLMKNDSGEALSITNGTNGGMNLTTVGNGTGMVTLNNGTVSLMGEGTTTVKVDGNGTTFGTLLGNKTTTINGDAITTGTVQAGNVTVNTGDKGTINSLANKTWDGINYVSGQAATEDQLQQATAAATTTVSGGKNIDIITSTDAKDGHKDYKVSLQDEVKLGDYDNGTGVYLSGASGTISATNSITVGEDQGVVIDGNKKTVNGLSNTTWNPEDYVSGQAATEGQLKSVSDDVNAGWIATDNNGNQITVNPTDNTLNFAGDRNIDVTADKEDGSIDVALKDNILLGGKDGSSSRVEIGGTNGTIMATKDADNMSATTTIDGGNIYAGSSVIVGTPDGNKVVMTDKDITGLTNTTWDGKTDNASRAATEGQLLNVDTKISQNIADLADVQNDVDTLANGAVMYDTDATGNVTDNVTIKGALKVGEKAIDVGERLSDYEEAGIMAGTIEKSENSIAIGTGAIVSANNSVALGVGSVARDENTVSVGAIGSYRRIVNVDAGIKSHDAVNMSQLHVLGIADNDQNGIWDIETPSPYTWSEDNTFHNGAGSFLGAINKNADDIHDLQISADTTQNLKTKVATFSAITNNVDWNAVNSVNWNAVSALSQAVPLSADATGEFDTTREPINGGSSNTGDEINTGKGNTVNGDSHVTGNAQIDGTLNVKGEATFDGNATFNGKVDMNGELNMNNNKITGLAEGSIAEGSTDAVTGGQLFDMQSGLNSRMDNIESRMNDVEDRIDKVGAMAAAIANLRTMGYDPEAPTEIAVGVGQYKSETGLALGIFHYPNQDFMLSASISTSGDEVMGGIGATWKLGRKSAEERAKDEEERILAKAEEIKQAAKRAEVKAQADRHAQLLAEREAAGEPIRPVEEA
uniref:YadA-like family protein n=1 Tax=Megamonas hypermegale TaxID=158847 RepID=UPI0026EBF9AC